MPTPSLSRMRRHQSPRWLLGVDALVAVVLMAFVATCALTMPSPTGPAVAATAALCLPAATVPGAVNGIAMTRAHGGAP